MFAEAQPGVRVGRLALLIASVVTIAAGAATWAVARAAGSPLDWSLILPLAVAIAATYAAPLRVDPRPDSESVHADDVFAIAATALLPYSDLVLTVTIAALLAPLARRLAGTRHKLRHVPPWKAAFNSAVIVVYGLVAGGVVSAVEVGSEYLAGRLAAAILGAFLANQLTRLAVAVAISLASDRHVGDTFRDATPPALIAFAGAAAYGTLLTLVLVAYGADVVWVAATLVTVLAGSWLLSARLGETSAVRELLQAASDVHANTRVQDVEAAGRSAATQLMRAQKAWIAERPSGGRTTLSVPLPSHTGAARWLTVERTSGSDRRIWDDERPLLEALAALVASARDNALLVERLDRSDASRAVLLAALSHDLRGHLAGALGAARAASDPRVDRETADELLAGQERRLAKMTDILDDLVELERAELAPEPTAVTRVDAVVAACVATTDVPDSIELLTDVGDVSVAMARRALERVLDNLLSNAVKHTPPGGRIRIRAWPDGERTVIAVEDTGPGVPEAVRAMILRPFVQVDSEDRRAAGVGLGLHVASRFASLYGGSLAVGSWAGGGASFQLHLPTADG